MVKITVDEWAEKSRRGEVCGILGCKNKPVNKCPHCGNHYCQEHAFVLDTPGHQKRFKFDWEGGLSELKEKFTSVELQHKASEWR